MIGLKNPGCRTEYPWANIADFESCISGETCARRATAIWMNGHDNSYLSQVITDLWVVKHYSP